MFTLVISYEAKHYKMNTYKSLKQKRWVEWNMARVIAVYLEN